MKAETQKILDDLKRAGFNTSSIEQQIAVDPTLSKAGDMILGDGILRQSQYTVYMNQFNREKIELENKIKELATAHDSHQFIAGKGDTDKIKESLDYIKQLEESLIGAGFSEESVRSASMVAGKGLQELIDKAEKQTTVTDNINVIKGADIPVNFDPAKYVDTDTLRASNANMAMGSILTNVQITQALEDAKSLGVVVTQEKLNELQKNLYADLNSPNGTVATAFDKTFDLPAIRATKSKEAQDKLIKDAFDRGRAEASKDGPIPSRSSQRLVLHPIIDRNSKMQTAIRSAEGDKKSFITAEGNIDPAALPKNEKGEVNRFMLRGNRQDRVSRAKDLFNKVEEHYAGDPTYVE